MTHAHDHSIRAVLLTRLCTPGVIPELHDEDATPSTIGRTGRRGDLAVPPRPGPHRGACPGRAILAVDRKVAFQT